MNSFFLHINTFQDPQATTLELGSIMEPEPIAFTFDTLGWKVLFVILILLCLFGVWKLYLRYKHNQYRREAIAELQTLHGNTQLSEVAFITKSVFILKRTALQSYPRDQVASLKGESWLQFLNSQVSGMDFLKYKEAIANAVYKEALGNEESFNKDDFFNMSLKWIKRHA
ncbi:protein of unknown function [Bizionia echini]|uniref:DUF4381 domain-containing protein n=1 Tax=Bizionia echini TaxID=649333 RepID=A0A1I4ZZA6_9FLAO|nr:DUF4381 domain-containing protein [Bizionia echini]SFN55379.1 protein of unknown function [Bizionia echini]